MKKNKKMKLSHLWCNIVCFYCARVSFMENYGKVRCYNTNKHHILAAWYAP